MSRLRTTDRPGVTRTRRRIKAFLRKSAAVLGVALAVLVVLVELTLVAVIFG